MPKPKDEFDELYPCDFYTPEELFEEGEMYTVYEIGRLLQGLDPESELEPDTEAILLDWAIPWVVNNGDDLVVGNPISEDQPGYYGLKREEDLTDE